MNKLIVAAATLVSLLFPGTVDEPSEGPHDGPTTHAIDWD